MTAQLVWVYCLITIHYVFVGPVSNIIFIIVIISNSMIIYLLLIQI